MNLLKKILLIIMVVIFISTINVDAAGVSIKSIDLVDSSGSVTELNRPSISGLSIDFDLAFSSVGDTVKYEVVLNNPTNIDYSIVQLG